VWQTAAGATAPFLKNEAEKCLLSCLNAIAVRLELKTWASGVEHLRKTDKAVLDDEQDKRSFFNLNNMN
jgi:hypothetical protein